MDKVQHIAPIREFRGRPSKGCEACRSRRVKCDETRPTCQKCVKTGKDCCYRDLADLAFRNESKAVARKAQKSWRQRAKHQTDSVASNPDFWIAQLARPSPPSQDPLPLSKRDIEEMAVNRWFYDYSIPGDIINPNRGVMDYLPDMYNSAGRDSCLHSAVLSVAYANFHRRGGSLLEDGKLLGRQYYGQALSRVSEATQNEETARSDQVIVAVYILGIYEIMSTGGDNPRFWSAHAYGLAALLKLREVPRFEDGFKYRMFQTINIQMLASCLRLGRESFLPFDMVEKHYDCEFPMVRLTGLMHQGADLVAHWRESTDPDDSSNHDEAQQVLEDMCLLDKKLAAWETTLPAFLYYGVYTDPLTTQPLWIRPILEHPGCVSPMHKYDTLQTAYGYNLYRMVRILVNKAILSSGKLPWINAPLDIGQSYALIRTLVNDICSSILAHFVVPILGKQEAQSEKEIVGIRAHCLLSSLTVAGTTLRAFPETKEMSLRADWVDWVDSFIREAIHSGGR